MSLSPTVTAIVVSYHTGPRLKECLFALRNDPDISEVIIVDNGNPPDMSAWIDGLAEANARLHVIRDGTNPGFGTAVNKGADGALGEYILVINPDAVLRIGSIPYLLEAASALPQPAVVGGKIFGIDGAEERGGRRKTLTLLRAMGLAKWTLEGEPLPEAAIPVGAISGAFFLMQRRAFRAMGGFDEAYFLHFEDVDLCRRALEAGGSVVYEPRAGALHYSSTSDVPSAFVEDCKAVSLGRYLKKFARGPLEKTAVAVLTPFIDRKSVV